MKRYTYDRRRDGRCDIRATSEGVIARTDDHRQAEHIVDALNARVLHTSEISAWPPGITIISLEGRRL